MGRDIYKKEREIDYKCRCGGELRLDFRDERTGGILIKDVPMLVCEKCGEEWYPPGVPRMIEGIREAVNRTGQVKIFKNLKIIHAV
jgi:YgiT-type zinc finger domain-containing protein